mgnify:CR=1 FL=1
MPRESKGRHASAVCGNGRNVMPIGWSTIAGRPPTTGSIFMISGLTPNIRSRCLIYFVAAALALLACPVSGDESATSFTLEKLMRDLAAVERSNGRFVERKYLKVLTSPLESSGTLSYVAPGQIEKRTLKPKAETLLVQGDKLVIQTQERRRELRLPDYPVLWAFVESLRGTLAGDVATLKRYYRVELEGHAGGWRLYLVPLDRNMNQVISLIQIAGISSRIRLVEVQETQGNRSVMKVIEDQP